MMPGAETRGPDPAAGQIDPTSLPVVPADKQNVADPATVPQSDNPPLPDTAVPNADAPLPSIQTPTETVASDSAPSSPHPAVPPVPASEAPPFDTAVPVDRSPVVEAVPDSPVVVTPPPGAAAVAVPAGPTDSPNTVVNASGAPVAVASSADGTVPVPTQGAAVTESSPASNPAVVQAGTAGAGPNGLLLNPSDLKKPQDPADPLINPEKEVLDSANPEAAVTPIIPAGNDGGHDDAEPTPPTPKHLEEKKQDAHKASVDLNFNSDGMSAPFQSALARRFDKVPVVWGKDVLAVSPGNLQARLAERLAAAEAQKVADSSRSTEPSGAEASADSDKQAKPERNNKYRPEINMYRNKPAVSEEQLTELIWGSYEQRTIDLFFAWEQARQSSELSHILERITNIEGVTAFIIFDIYENEKYPPESEDGENMFEEGENGNPVEREQKLQMIDGKWKIPPHIIYTSTDLATAKKIIPFTKQLIWRLIETTRDLDGKNDVRYLRLISDINEIVVMPMFPRHFLIAVQEPKSSPNVLFENLGIVTTHPAPVAKDDIKQKARKKSSVPVNGLESFSP
ncbi:hypothetical protein BV898_07513 [Hypsibius exemplaris]|uniref:Uncharacterized protein n=1 Tax=Hypsibius exemplaris TaxID=2072580 RepID=A0A1W0WTG7_HYPEX|nr:hypothetical protein BV898_07513 [Hypsibius exemplaris]